MAKSPQTPTEPAARAPRKAGRPTSAKPRSPRTPKPAPVEEEVAAAPNPAPAPEQVPEQAIPAFPGAEQAQLIETLSMNLAKAAMMAQSAIAEAALSQADRPAALSADPFNVAPAMSSVMTSLAARPEKLFHAQADLFGRYMELWTSTARQAGGEAPTPAPADKRFKDPAWSENPMFDMMRRSAAG